MKYCWQSLFTFSCCVTCENGSWPVNFCSSVFSNDADMIFAALLKDPKIVEVRRMKLQTYLRLVIAQLSRDFPELVEHACRQTLIQTVPFFSYVFRVISFTKCHMLLVSAWTITHYIAHTGSPLLVSYYLYSF